MVALHSIRNNKELLTHVSARLVFFRLLFEYEEVVAIILQLLHAFLNISHCSEKKILS